MAGIKNFATLRNLLLECAPIDNPAGLVALFADERLHPFRNSLPDLMIMDRAGRAEALIAYLSEKKNAAGENALTLFWQVLLERTDLEDLCHARLSQQLSGKDRANNPMPLSARQQHKCQELQTLFDLLSDKLARLTKAQAIEINPATKFQLEHQVNEAQTERDKIEAEMDSLGCS